MATYDGSLLRTSERDWLRFRIGDVNYDAAGDLDVILEDEEIDALLVEEANKWLAAAEALTSIKLRFASAGRGVLEKQVSRLRIKRGMDSSAAAAMDREIATLRQRGNVKLAPVPSVLRVLGSS